MAGRAVLAGTAAERIATDLVVLHAVLIVFHDRTRGDRSRFKGEPHRVCRRLQLLRRRSLHEQDSEHFSPEVRERAIRIQAAGTGGLGARHILTGGVATPSVSRPTTARAGVEAVNAVAFHPSQSVGAENRMLSKPHEQTKVVIATYLSFSKRAGVFGDAKMTTALLDQLTHHCHIVDTGNDSFRYKASAATAKTRNDTPPA